MKENIHGSFGVRVKKDWKQKPFTLHYVYSSCFVLCDVYV